MGFLGEKREFLADQFTPDFLMGLCEGLTEIQAQASMQPFIGRWLRLVGDVLFATPNPVFGSAGVTIIVPGDRPREVYLWFERDLDRLAQIGIGESITVEGQITSISSDTIRLQNCGLADPRIASSMKVKAAAQELKKAADDWTARQQNAPQSATLGPKSKTEPIDEDRKNLTAAEAKRLCEFLLSELPNVTERDAHKRAVAFFHDRKVPRDWFIDIFRAIRGPKSPGKQPTPRS
jgi:hypothetical protein